MGLSLLLRRFVGRCSEASEPEIVMRGSAAGTHVELVRAKFRYSRSIGGDSAINVWELGGCLTKTSLRSLMKAQRNTRDGAKTCSVFLRRGVRPSGRNSRTAFGGRAKNAVVGD